MHGSVAETTVRNWEELIMLKIKQPALKILGPFAIFLIIAGIGHIIVDTIQAIFGFEKTLQFRLRDVMWIVGSICGLVYSVVMLRYLLKGNLIDKFFYGLLIVIFVVLSVIKF